MSKSPRGTQLLQFQAERKFQGSVGKLLGSFVFLSSPLHPRASSTGPCLPFLPLRSSSGQIVWPLLILPIANTLAKVLLPVQWPSLDLIIPPQHPRHAPDLLLRTPPWGSVHMWTCILGLLLSIDSSPLSPLLVSVAAPRPTSPTHAHQETHLFLRLTHCLHVDTQPPISSPAYPQEHGTPVLICLLDLFPAHIPGNLNSKEPQGLTTFPQLLLLLLGPLFSTQHHQCRLPKSDPGSHP